MSKSQQAHNARDPDPGLPLIAQVLNMLFTSARRPDGGKWSERTATAACQQWLQENVPEDQTTRTFSNAYMGQLRRGERTNPRFNHLRAICAVFGVGPEIFHDSPKGALAREDFSLTQAMKATGVEAIAMRAAALGSRGREALLRHMEEIEASEARDRGE